MNRRVRRKLTRKDKQPLFPDDDVTTTVNRTVDWSTLPNDTILQLFSLLNHRDRASLSSTCHTWHSLSSATCLWTSLDLRHYNLSTTAAASLSSRSSALTSLRFRGADAANAVINLRAKNLRSISGDYCRKISDATLSVIAARHELLETLILGPDFSERISSDAIKAVGMCCPKLRRLKLSGVREIDFDAINVIAKNCVDLIDLGFIDCLKVDETALSNVCSLKYLSVSGTSNLKWDLVRDLWSKLPNLVGLDVSRTDIGPSDVLRLLFGSKSLRVMCVMNCSLVEADESYRTSWRYGKCCSNGKSVISLCSDVFQAVETLFVDNSMNGKNVFLEWRNCEKRDRRLEEIMNWLEWILSHSLLRIAESNPPNLDSFWVSQGATLLLSLMQSSQEDVQERSATGLATFVVIDDQNASIDGQRAEAVMRGGGVKLLLKLASSCREGLQVESAKV